MARRFKDSTAELEDSLTEDGQAVMSEEDDSDFIVPDDDPGAAAEALRQVPAKPSEDDFDTFCDYVQSVLLSIVPVRLDPSIDMDAVEEAHHRAEERILHQLLQLRDEVMSLHWVNAVTGLNLKRRLQALPKLQIDEDTNVWGADNDEDVLIDDDADRPGAFRISFVSEQQYEQREEEDDGRDGMEVDEGQGRQRRRAPTTRPSALMISFVSEQPYEQREEDDGRGGMVVDGGQGRQRRRAPTTRCGVYNADEDEGEEWDVSRQRHRGKARRVVGIDDTPSQDGPVSTSIDIKATPNAKQTPITSHWGTPIANEQPHRVLTPPTIPYPAASSRLMEPRPVRQLGPTAFSSPRQGGAGGVRQLGPSGLTGGCQPGRSHGRGHGRRAEQQQQQEEDDTLFTKQVLDGRCGICNARSPGRGTRAEQQEEEEEGEEGEDALLTKQVLDGRCGIFNARSHGHGHGTRAEKQQQQQQNYLGLRGGRQPGLRDGRQPGHSHRRGHDTREEQQQEQEQEKAALLTKPLLDGRCGICIERSSGHGTRAGQEQEQQQEEENPLLTKQVMYERCSKDSIENLETPNPPGVPNFLNIDFGDSGDEDEEGRRGHEGRGPRPPELWASEPGGPSPLWSHFYATKKERAMENLCRNQKDQAPKGDQAGGPRPVGCNPGSCPFSKAPSMPPYSPVGSKKKPSLARVLRPDKWEHITRLLVLMLNLETTRRLAPRNPAPATGRPAGPKSQHGCPPPPPMSLPPPLLSSAAVEVHWRNDCPLTKSEGQGPE
eukprot:gene28648-31818_t